MRRLFLSLFAFAAAACSGAAPAEPQPSGKRAVAYFAGGCFWCTEADFEKLPGVYGAVSGYTGGRTANPDYESVTAGGTGHYEAVGVVYDPARISYETLVRHFFRTIDPTDAGGQFCDRGESYRTAVFAATPAQRAAAEAAKAEAQKALGQKVVTPVLPAARFHAAEKYHQDYSRKNPIRYRYYRSRCGRDARLKALWGG